MSENGAQRYRVEHHTAYRYSEPVMLSHQQLHLTPRPLDYQQCSAHEVVIRPNPTSRREFIDAFGNPVAELAIETAHSALDIVARTAVEVTRRPPVEFHKTPAWETVREALAYRAASAPMFPTRGYLYSSPAVVGSTSIRPTMFSLRRNILPLDGAATSPTSRRCAASLTAAASKPSKSR